MGLQSSGKCFCFLRPEAMQHKLFDVQVDAAHTHPRVSASDSERSILGTSNLAASIRSDISTGLSKAAARNAALSAMLRILPPITLSCASFFGSRLDVG